MQLVQYKIHTSIFAPTLHESWEFLDQLIDYQLIQEDLVAWI
jgi:hypothetical protein